jgi:hypothetical protein
MVEINDIGFIYRACIKLYAISTPIRSDFIFIKINNFNQIIYTKNTNNLPSSK